MHKYLSDDDMVHIFSKCVHEYKQLSYAVAIKAISNSKNVHFHFFLTFIVRVYRIQNPKQNSINL